MAKKKQQAALPYQRCCMHCGNFWGRGGCRERFGDKTSEDEYCHYKRSKFWFKSYLR